MTGRAIMRLCGSAMLALALQACVSVPSGARLAAPAPIFDPLAFFAGRTTGDGRLKVAFSAERGVRVEGTGRLAPDGALALEQRVEEEGKPPRTRRWQLRALGPGQYGGTLSDAAGPVRATVRGNLLRLTFAMKGGFAVEQRLYLQADRQVALNTLVVRKFGLPVAVLRETIRRRAP